MNLPSLSIITENNRQIARAIMLLATLFLHGVWRPCCGCWQGKIKVPGQSQPVTPAIAQVSVDGSRLASFSILKHQLSSTIGVANAPDTSLQLKLDGVFAANLQSQSSAIISEQKGKVSENCIVLDSRCQVGQLLSAVYVDRVLLQRNGQDEVLRFIKTNLLEGDAPPKQNDATVQLTPQASAKWESKPVAY